MLKKQRLEASSKKHRWLLFYTSMSLSFLQTHGWKTLNVAKLHRVIALRQNQWKLAFPPERHVSSTNAELTPIKNHEYLLSRWTLEYVLSENKSHWEWVCIHYERGLKRLKGLDFCISMIKFHWVFLKTCIQATERLHHSSENQIKPICSADKSYKRLLSSGIQTCDPWKMIQDAIMGRDDVNLFIHSVPASHCKRCKQLWGERH